MSSRQTLDAGATRQPAESVRTFSSSHSTTTEYIGTSTGNLRHSPRPEILALGEVGAVGSMRDPIEAMLDRQGRQVEGFKQTGLRKWGTPGNSELKQLMTPQELQRIEELKQVEKNFNASDWPGNHLIEPGHRLAWMYGMHRSSIYTVFVQDNGDDTYGCRHDGCHTQVDSLEDAITHQRYHHFDHRPFECIPLSGAQW